MLAMISTSLMLFVDRLFLARYNLLALNAAAIGAISYFIFLVLPMSITGIAEVLVGRLHGEDRHNEVGIAVWQMVGFGLILLPLFIAIGFALPQLLFLGSEIQALETDFFRSLMFFAVFQCTTIAFSGFFIGIGQVKVVTISAIAGNLVNVLLDYILIFGWGPIPSYGVAGAAVATGISQGVQSLFLLSMMLRKKNRLRYHTQRCRYHAHFFKEGLRIGTPSGLGHTLEVIGHFVFFRIVMSVGQVQMTIVAMVQSFYILCSFANDAGSKAAGSIIANLLGANARSSIKKVFRSAFTLQLLYFCIFASLLFGFSDFLINLFVSSEDHELLQDPIVMSSVLKSLFCMTLFFLFDGFSWILIGFLTAAGDTRFIFYASLFIHWVAYVIPTLIFIGLEKQGADVAWAIIAGMSFISALVYLWRYKSGSWLRNYKAL